MSKLATKQDLNKIIEKAVKRIGEDQVNIRDTEGVTITNEDIKKEREVVIEESLKEAANEAAETLVLENTITGMVKDIISEQDKKKLNILQKFDKFIQSTTMKNLAKKLASPDISWDDWKEAMEAYKHAEGRVVDLEILQGITPEDYGKYKESVWDGEKYISGSEAEGEWYGDPNMKGKISEQTVNETTTDMIKKLVSKKLRNINEVEKSTPSLDQVSKTRKESGKETKQYHNEVEKKFKEYAESDKAEENSPMYRNEDEQSEFIDDWRGMGLEDADGVGELERISDYLGGSSKTGNAQVDEDGNDLGNVVSTELGEKIEKKIKRKKEKIENQKSHMRNARGYSPAVQKTVKESINESVKTDMEKIKKLFNYNDKTQ